MHASCRSSFVCNVTGAPIRVQGRRSVAAVTKEFDRLSLPTTIRGKAAVLTKGRVVHGAAQAAQCIDALKPPPVLLLRPGTPTHPQRPAT